MEEFGREMYKLYKMFSSKAKQIVREKEKEAGGGMTGGVRRDAAAAAKGSLDLEGQYAPLKLSGLVQENVKQFKVRVKSTMHGKQILLGTKGSAQPKALNALAQLPPPTLGGKKPKLSPHATIQKSNCSSQWPGRMFDKANVNRPIWAQKKARGYMNLIMSL